MPIYEGIGLIGEKKQQPIVIEIGSAFTKCGYGEELSPRAILPTVVRLDGEWRHLHELSDTKQLYRALLQLMHTVYFKHLLANPKNQPVVVVESPLGSIQLRETLAKVLFKHFEVPACVWAPLHALAALPLAAPRVLVLDLGHSGATAVPVCHGVSLIHAAHALPVGARAVQSALLDELVARATVLASGASITASAITSDVLQDIQVRACYAARMSDAAAAMAAESAEPGADDAPPVAPPVARVQPAELAYPLAHGATLRVPGDVRWRAVECLFTDNVDGQCLATLVLDTLIKSPIDLRRPLAENLLLIGGLAHVPGIKARLLAELRHRVARPPYSGTLHVKTFKAHVPPANDNYVAWLGGSLFGNCDAVAMEALTREQYLESNESLPDWSNINPSNTTPPIRSC